MRIVQWLAVLVVVVGLDQGSKAWARTLPVHPANCDVPGALIAGTCAGVRQPVVTGYWDWELAFNTGAAFSSFVGGQWLLALLAALALVWIAVVAVRSRADERLKRVALGLIAAGALGNLVDRLRDDAVTDFIRWHVHDHLWPIFNIADAALLIGVGLLFVESALRHRKTSPPARPLHTLDA